MTDEYADEHGTVGMARTRVNPRRDPHTTHDADHFYRLTATATTFTFTYDRFHRHQGWQREIDCESVAELLAAGVEQTRERRRRARILRRQQGLRPDQRSWIPPISYLTDQIRLCEQRSEQYARAFGRPRSAPTTGIVGHRVARHHRSRHERDCR